MEPLKALFIADMHIGSIDALMPPSVEIYDEDFRTMRITHNKVQKMLWEKWKEMCKEDYDVCFVVGDMIEGINRKENGKGNWTNEIDVQIRVAGELLRMIGAKEYYGYQGSPYHTGINASADADVMKFVNGHFATDGWVTLNDVRFHLKHVVGTSSVLKGRSTSLNGDMEAIKMYPETYGNVDVHIRAHAHYYHYVGWEQILGMILPCWKSKDDFMRRGGVTYGNDCGYVVFDCFKGKYTFQANTFKIPQKLAISDKVITKK